MARRERRGVRQAHACCVRQARTCGGIATLLHVQHNAQQRAGCRSLSLVAWYDTSRYEVDDDDAAVDAHGAHDAQSDAAAHSGGGAVRCCSQRRQGGRGSGAPPTQLAVEAATRLRRGGFHAAERAARRACARGAIPFRSVRPGTRNLHQALTAGGWGWTGTGFGQAGCGWTIRLHTSRS